MRKNCLTKKIRAKKPENVRNCESWAKADQIRELDEAGLTAVSWPGRF
jgi:hypothetical protein